MNVFNGRVCNTRDCKKLGPAIFEPDFNVTVLASDCDELTITCKLGNAVNRLWLVVSKLVTLERVGLFV